VSLPRLLAIMGSGETSPTMVKTHRDIFGRLGPAAPAVLLDTPFGFQENADDIAAKALEYFRASVGHRVEVASFRRADGPDPLAREAALARIRQAAWVFAGPGSPTYTLRQWGGTDIPDLLADKLRHGGVVNFASAAALTLGAVTVPVYEIYKVGADPVWEPGLDLLGPLGLGLHVAVIPHYDNAEGGNHDTRFCYLGERRLRLLEALLPADTFVLGIDEHTGCLLDLDAGTATVVGLGQVTVRRQGCSSVVAAGTTMGIDALVALAEEGMGKGLASAATRPLEDSSSLALETPRPLSETIRQQEAAFDTAIAGRDVDAAVRAVLTLDDALAAWGADTLQSDEQDRGRGAVRRMVVALGELARVGARDPRAVIGPYVQQLLALRDSARAGRRFDEADAVRDQLVALGVAVRDTPSGTEWDPPSLLT
jgi:hypothetical protein